MAIKVNGCTVIDDSRNVNAGVSTATTGCVTGTLTGATVCATTGCVTGTLTGATVCATTGCVTGTLTAGTATVPGTVTGGVVSATTCFSGSGAGLSNIPSAAITGGISALDVCTFTGSGTWTKPASAKYVYVEVLSGGGGGTGYYRCQALNFPYSGGNLPSGVGGRSGYFITGNYLASDLPPSIPVTVGAGGPAGSGDCCYCCNDEHYRPKGGASCFGSFLATGVLGCNNCLPGCPATFCCQTGSQIGNSGGSSSFACYNNPGWPGAPGGSIGCRCGCPAPSNSNIACWTETQLSKYIYTGGAGGSCNAPRAGSPGPGYAGGGAGGFFGAVCVTPTGGPAYGPVNVCWNGAPGGAGPGGNGGTAAGGGAGAFGCPGGAGGNGRVVVYTWS